MGDLARQRSRPWLMATAGVLLLVSLAVAGFLIWIVRATSTGTIRLIDVNLVRAVAVFDLMLTVLIALSIMLLGQAIVSYEVFTGKVLPRRGFFRYWRNAILLAAGYALVIGWSLVTELRPIYSLILTTLLMVSFYALLSWRSFVERDQFIKRLRPFVTSQRLTQQLIRPEDGSPSRANALFQTVCHEILGAKEAQLIALGVLAPLAGPPLIYPPHKAKAVMRPPTDQFMSVDITVVALNGEQYGGLRWAIPLWAERGLIGALLLGEKQDGGLYTQEEIEIARAAGERIIDALAGEQMAARLMEFQRQRMFESRVLDLRTRRILHDEVLPTLHTAVLTLSGLAREHPHAQEAIKALSGVHLQIADLIHTLPGTPAVIANGNLIAAIRTMVQSEFAAEFHAVSWQVQDNLSPLLDPLAYEIVYTAVREAIRNAAAHGRGQNPERKLSLVIEIKQADWIVISIKDDGVGLSYQPPADSSPPSHRGSGSGLALHSTMMAIIGGYLTVETPRGGGTQVLITFPPLQTEPDGAASTASGGLTVG